jgi:hypothetical protein
VPSRFCNSISDNIYDGSEGKAVSIAANESIICNSNNDRTGFNIDTASSGAPSKRVSKSTL